MSKFLCGKCGGDDLFFPAFVNVNDDSDIVVPEGAEPVCGECGITEMIVDPSTEHIIDLILSTDADHEAWHDYVTEDHECAGDDCELVAVISNNDHLTVFIEQTADIQIWADFILRFRPEDVVNAIVVPHEVIPVCDACGNDTWDGSGEHDVCNQCGAAA